LFSLFIILRRYVNSRNAHETSTENSNSGPDLSTNGMAKANIKSVYHSKRVNTNVAIRVNIQILWFVLKNISLLRRHNFLLIAWQKYLGKWQRARVFVNYTTGEQVIGNKYCTRHDLISKTVKWVKSFEPILY